MPRPREDGGWTAAPREAWFPPWLGPLAVALAFSVLARWSWRKWPDPLFDFGNQLYLPWQLSLGRTLYVDLDYKEGPLSQYANATLFQVFGVSFTTLVWANLAIIAALCGLIYVLFARACGRVAATVTTLVFLAVFAFPQYTGRGSFNYVCPYTHEQTHGVFLAIAMICLLGEYARRGQQRWCAAAGACLGLVFLTKAEVFLPALAAAGMALILILAAPPPIDGKRVRALAVFLGAWAVPVVLSWLLLMTKMPPAAAARSVARSWAHMGPAIFEERFYLVGMGLDDPWHNLLWAVSVFLGMGGVVLVVGGLDRLFTRIQAARALWCVAAAAGLFATLTWHPALVLWGSIGRALPITTLLMIVVLLAAFIRSRHDHDTRARLLPLCAWAAFSFLLLPKMILNVRLGHYGFVLAMPATLLLVATLVWLVPNVLRSRPGGGELARAALVALALAGAGFYLQWTNKHYQRKDWSIGAGGDAMMATNPNLSHVEVGLSLAAEELQTLMGPSSTLLVLPEGTILNYWLRRSNPTRYSVFTPPVLHYYAGSEAHMLEDIEAHAPDFIALVDRNGDEFGVGAFGSDPRWGRQIMEWVTRHYTRVDRIGAEPFQGRGFGIVILRRAQ